MTLQAASRWLAALAAVAPVASAQFVQVPGVGWEGQGADLAVLQLDADPRPDLILVAYDNPQRDNTFRYRVGLNLNAAGVATTWLPDYVEVPGVGWEGQGAGAAVADFDGNGRADLVLMAYDNPQRDNSFRYKIGWNLDAQGRTANWTNHAQVPGVGWEGQGAAVAIGQIDTNPRPDMLFIAYDNPARDNTFRYRVGFNVDTGGNATWAPNFVEVPGVGWEGQGLGAAIVNLDTNARPDLVLLAYDNPQRDNSFRYRTGLNLNASGVAATWQPGFQTLAGMGWEGQGAGLAITCLDTDRRADWIVMAYDNPQRDNSFRYRVLPNRSRAPCPPPIGTAVAGGTTQRKSITQLTPAELDSLRRAYRQMIAWNDAPRDSANFRRSLRYWANMHSYFGTGCRPTSGMNQPGMSGITAQSPANANETATWCKCEHGTVQFLTWHRMYLYYFEQVLQAASGDPNLRLPYFDYNTNAQMPLSYREGTTATNPLRIDNRQASLNNGTSSISPSATSTTAAMGNTAYNGFNSSLEGTPHGSVHCAIGVQGCPTGYMGAVPAAGNDPIFYSHHANIDRLYECWLAVSPGTRLPTNAGQLGTSYSFVDGAGNVVSRKVSDMLTTAQLGYSYASGGGCPPRQAVSAVAATPEVKKFQVIPNATTLERGVTTVPLRFAPEARSAIAPTGEAEKPVKRALVVIEGLEADESPGVMYEVYLKRGDGDRALVGIISFFGFGEHEGHGDQAGGMRVELDATEALRTLGTQDAQLEFEPTTGVTDSTVAKAVANIRERANVRFKSATLEVEK
ncbi:MAG TPA: tyrosinase family protein [Tahibacter sp.]|nr:tyrosinase family protein [Tahibacter sp.]